jgi:GNAT superfamily N-acetyltransferase
MLEVLGVEPSAQRRGVGSRLVEYGLEQARSDGVGAFLLTSSREVLPFYTRSGSRWRKTRGSRRTADVVLWRRP